MGVLGLWQILESVGHPIKLEALEGKRLAVDANIWLYKFICGFKLRNNGSDIESHKLGLFNRISKLLFYKIKPIFVFDGPAPVLKRRTLERRQKAREKQSASERVTAFKIFADQLMKQNPGLDIKQIKAKLPNLKTDSDDAESDSDPDCRITYVGSGAGTGAGTGTGSRHFDDGGTLTVTTRIVEEAKELLTLFGVPFIDAFGEAEAQCALLERLKFTEGTITDDSDIWLFGAQNVYRNLFSDDKYVMQYKFSEILYHLRLTRENLVCFAMLVGSDYTDGIMNVGPVTALEILSEFPGEAMDPLVKFKQWRQAYDKSEEKILGSKKREKLLKFEIPSDFPSSAIYDGYMDPMADDSEEKFSWGVPDEEALKEYARRQFGWDKRRIEERLVPVMRRVSEKKSQTTIESYFFRTAMSAEPERFRSKRVNEALKRIAASQSQQYESEQISSDSDCLIEEPQAGPSKRSGQAARSRNKRAKAAN